MSTQHAYCNTKGCLKRPVLAGFCQHHAEKEIAANLAAVTETMFDLTLKTETEAMEAILGTSIQRGITDKPSEANMSMADKYPKYYKHIPKGAMVLDVYAICQMFPVDDATGCINHARKKLLVPGTRTGGKSFYQDIKEARDTLNRYLELHAGDQHKTE